VIVSTFVDDQLYSILYYLRITKAISCSFGIASYSWDPLMDIMTSMGSDAIIQISSCQFYDVGVQNPLPPNLIFAPYPIATLEFGQIIHLKQNLDAHSVVVQLYGYDRKTSIQFGTNSTVAALIRFIQESRPTHVFGPPELAMDQREGFPAVVQVSDSLVRWMDVTNLMKYTRNFGDLRVVSGRLEGERAILGPIERQRVVNVPDIEELGFRLMEQGATKMQKRGNIVTCEFPFIPGDNKVAIEFGETITITTGSGVIEDEVAGLIGASVAFPL
jgi:hypothetical protein